MGYFFSICFCPVINKRIHFSLTPSLSKSLIFKKLILLLSILLFFTNQSIAADVTIFSDDSSDYSFTNGDTLAIKNVSEASGKLIFSGSTTITGIDNNDEISGEINSAAVTSLTVEVSITNNNLLISGQVNINGSLTKIGNGILTLSGTSTYKGATTISAGTLTVSGTLSNSTDVVNSGTYNVNNSDTIQSLSGSGNTVIASSQTLTTGDSGNDEVSGVISGSGAFTKAGSGILTLSDDNTYTGVTTINAGTLTVSGTLSNSTAVSVASGATYDVDQTDTVASIEGSGNIEIASSKTLTAGDGNDKISSGVISGAGALTKAGSGVLTLSGTNTYTGNTTVSEGTLEIQGQLENGNYDGSIANSGTLAINSSSNQTLAGVISGNGTLTKSSSGTLTLSGNNTYIGITTINAGTLKVSGTLADRTAVTIASGATYDVDASDTVASIEGAGNIDIASSKTLTAGDSNNKTSSGVISGSGALTKAGSGTQTLVEIILTQVQQLLVLEL